MAWTLGKIIASAVSAKDIFTRVRSIHPFALVGVVTQISSSYWICGSLDKLTTSSITAPPSQSSTDTHSGSQSSLQKSSSPPIAAIAGGAVGVVVVLCLILACWLRLRRAKKRQMLEPRPLLHHRGLSEQTTRSATTLETHETHISPFSPGSQAAIRRAEDLPPRKRPFVDMASVGTPGMVMDSSIAHSPVSSEAPILDLRRESSVPAANTLTTQGSSTDVSSNHAALSFGTPLTPASRPRRPKLVRTGTSSTHPRGRDSPPPPPDAPLPVSTHEMEERLMMVLNEADRQLAEIRTQRVQGMPPPYAPA